MWLVLVICSMPEFSSEKCFSERISKWLHGMFVIFQTQLYIYPLCFCCTKLHISPKLETIWYAENNIYIFISNAFCDYIFMKTQTCIYKFYNRRIPTVFSKATLTSTRLHPFTQLLSAKSWNPASGIIYVHIYIINIRLCRWQLLLFTVMLSVRI